MTLIILTYLAGILTILSPCIFPVLPFVFAKSEGSFLKSRLPLLLGMALTFSLFSGLAVIGGEWLIKTNEIGRWVALFILALFGLFMIFPRIAESTFAPIARIGSKISNLSNGESIKGSFAIGVGTGLLWAPCAGPVLGLVLTGVASQEQTWQSLGLLLSYSLGAATSLAIALTAGQGILTLLRKFIKIDHQVKRGLGLAVIMAVIAIAFHFDRLGVSKNVFARTDAVESKLISLMETKKEKFMSAPDFSGANTWINSSPLKMEDLKGKVVLVEFWTYSCINCLNTLPYVKQWHEKYKDKGLVIIGVHTPEYGYERILKNVESAVSDLGIKYPVAVDNNYKIWNAYSNQYWPAHYFVDRSGRIQGSHFGEGDYAESEKLIKKLIAEEAII